MIIVKLGNIESSDNVERFYVELFRYWPQSESGDGDLIEVNSLLLWKHAIVRIGIELSRKSILLSLTSKECTT